MALVFSQPRTPVPPSRAKSTRVRVPHNRNLNRRISKTGVLTDPLGDLLDDPLLQQVAEAVMAESAKVAKKGSRRKPKARDYTAVMDQYAEDVIAGTIPASVYCRLAAERHKRDLTNQRTSDFPYYYDREAAHRACKVIERLPHIKGRWANEGLTIHLEPWQCFFICSVFGWLHVDTGYRRFREAYLEVARKNAKTTIAAGMGIVGLGPDNEAGAEIYSAALQSEQSRIVLDVAREMLKRCPGYLKKYNARVREHMITADGGAKKFRSLSREGYKKVEGENPHIGILDELHLHPTRGVYDAIETGMGSRTQPLMLMITTAGNDDSSVCYQVRSQLIKILKQEFRLDSMFGIIYCIDDSDEWDDEAAWPKANPNLGVSVSLDQLRDLATKARQNPEALASFLTRRCCRWVSGSQDWIAPTVWHKAGDASLTLGDFAGSPCILALDLAATRDLVAMGALFKRKGTYYLFGKSFIPEAAVKTKANNSYPTWVADGALIATPGETHDHEIIQQYVEDFAKLHPVHRLGYDRFQAHNIARRLEKLDGFKPRYENGETVSIVEEIPQQRAIFSEPMKAFEALVHEGRIRHDANPCHSWQLLNVIAERDHRDRLQPVRQTFRQKIDMGVAWIMCLTLELRFPLPAAPPRRRFTVSSVPLVA